jgi:hypothetical protein
MTYEEHQAKWTAAFIAAGHEFQMVDPKDGDPTRIDWFATCCDIHNGPRCVKCGWDCCVHCTSMTKIHQCTGVQS